MRWSFAFVAILLPLAAFTQDPPEWTLLPDSPFNNNRSEDVFFVDADHGWAVIGAGAGGEGELHRTTDGGDNWTMVSNPNGFLRGAGFVSELKGWVGVLDDPVRLYETTDGGFTMTDITARIQPAIAGGICGLWVVNDQVAYGVGQHSGPAYVIKTTDGGQTWSSTDLSPIMERLIDVYFFDAQNGLATGAFVTANLVPRIIGTEDGGATWTVRHTAGFPAQGWKFSFPTPQIGYVSTEIFQGTEDGLLLKTTDGGQTWTELFVPGGGSMQGTGFLTPDIGWTSGLGTTSVTTDGGQTWQQIELDGDINRFRFLGDSLGFAAGHQIYRLGPLPVAVEQPSTPHAFGLESIAPNPASGPITITYHMARPGHATIAVYDLLGRTVATLDQGVRSAGRHVVTWEPSTEGRAPAAGTYVVRLQTQLGSSAQLITLARACGREC